MINKLICSRIFSYVMAVALYLVAIIEFLSGDDQYMAIIWLCLGTTWICIGSAYTKKSKDNEEKK